jgi:hypothetical protein
MGLTLAVVGLALVALGSALMAWKNGAERASGLTTGSEAHGFLPRVPSLFLLRLKNGVVLEFQHSFPRRARDPIAIAANWLLWNRVTSDADKQTVAPDLVIQRKGTIS